MAEERHEWGDWLREQFDRHPTIRIPAELARAAGRKDNGRPVIDPSRITQWLRGQRPSYDLAVATARAFHADEGEALAAAGYDVPSAGAPPRAVGPSDDAAPLFRYQRPPGLTDQEWDDLRRQHADYWDWLVERAARER
jgi:transcriptional regulator with XRE-family HTH domain